MCTTTSQVLCFIAHILSLLCKRKPPFWMRDTRRFGCMTLRIEVQSNAPNIITIVNIEIPAEHRGKGTLKRLLPRLERLLHRRGFSLVFDSLMNERLHQFLLKRGYKPFQGNTCGPSVILGPDVEDWRVPRRNMIADVRSPVFEGRVLWNIAFVSAAACGIMFVVAGIALQQF